MNEAFFLFVCSFYHGSIYLFGNKNAIKKQQKEENENRFFPLPSNSPTSPYNAKILCNW